MAVVIFCTIVLCTGCIILTSILCNWFWIKVSCLLGAVLIGEKKTVRVRNQIKLVVAILCNFKSTCCSYAYVFYTLRYLIYPNNCFVACLCLVFTSCGFNFVQLLQRFVSDMWFTGLTSVYMALLYSLDLLHNLRCHLLVVWSLLQVVNCLPRLLSVKLHNVLCGKWSAWLCENLILTASVECKCCDWL